MPESVQHTLSARLKLTIQYTSMCVACEASDFRPMDIHTHSATLVRGCYLFNRYDKRIHKFARHVRTHGSAHSGDTLEASETARVHLPSNRGKCAIEIAHYSWAHVD